MKIFKRLSVWFYRKVWHIKPIQNNNKNTKNMEEQKNEN